jgi:pimeloyl-ACP methyl ester carboxylesterase
MPGRAAGCTLALLPGALVAAGVLAACGGTKSAGTASTSSRAVDPPAKRCGPPARPAEVVTLRTSDGVRLDGAIVGSGPRGVVLVHEAGAQVLCGWWPYAARLADRGFRVLLFDLRCYGLSDCPAKGEDNVVSDVAAAVEELRDRGGTSIQLVGASYGGSIALVAASRLDDLTALADLSGDELTSSIGGQGRPTTAVRAASGVHVPTLLAVARNDGYIGLPDERALYRRLASSRKRLIVLPVAAGHGWDLLAWPHFERTLTAFLVEHAP